MVTLVGKTWDLHVRDDLRISQKANLEIIADSIAFMKKRVDEVIFDAEHFFDGFRANPGLCAGLSQSGRRKAAPIGSCSARPTAVGLPGDIRDALAQVNRVDQDAARAFTATTTASWRLPTRLAGVEMGATQVQGTINGFGERCGNVNLISVIANLQLKMGKKCVTPAQLKKLREVSQLFYELANIQPNKRQAYVGDSAFAHKGGLHVSGVLKNRETYEHIDPELVGNRQRVLVSDLSGRSNVVYKGKEYGIDLKDARRRGQKYFAPHQGAGKPRLRVPSRGGVFRAADPRSARQEEEEFQSGRLSRHRRKTQRGRGADFRSDDHGASRRRDGARRGDGQRTGQRARPGAAPRADQILSRRSNRSSCSIIKFACCRSGEGTGAVVRVLIESGDGKDRWGTVGVSHNVIEASWQALVDSIDYKLYKDARHRTN